MPVRSGKERAEIKVRRKTYTPLTTIALLASLLTPSFLFFKILGAPGSNLETPTPFSQLFAGLSGLVTGWVTMGSTLRP